MRHSTTGFTLVEFLLALAVFTLVILAATPSYTSFQTSAQLNESVSELVQTIRLARERAVARAGDVAHGVYLESNQYTLYRGASYASRTTSHDRVIALENSLTLSTTVSGSEINFSKGLGIPGATGTITLTHDVQGTKTVTIDAFGSVQR